MIYGIGIDMVDVGRFKAAMERRGARFSERLFTASELSYCLSKRFPERHLAARFAAKSSLFKALGRPLRFKDVEVARDDSGRPFIRAVGLLPGMRVSVSMSHDANYGIAEAVIERPA
jgi:holo-[acyl-carrier protein] synthase